MRTSRLTRRAPDGVQTRRGLAAHSATGAAGLEPATPGFGELSRADRLGPKALGSPAWRRLRSVEISTGGYQTGYQLRVRSRRLEQGQVRQDHRGPRRGPNRFDWSSASGLRD